MLKGWLKFFIGLLLIPVAVGLGLALYDVTRVWLPAEPWRSGWFWSLFSGAWAWVIIFMLMPRPLWFYVLGHELTHALTVWMAGGRVYDIQVGSKGGYVTSSKVNWWIALSPYFVPFYTVLWLLLWLSIDFYADLSGYSNILFFGCGLTYAFHITFTLNMLHPDQSDLINEGWVFSIVIILLMNLLLLFLVLVPVAEGVSWKEGFAILGQRIGDAYIFIGSGIAGVYNRLGKFYAFLISGGKT